MMNIYHILFSKLIPLHLCVLVVTILADYTIEIITTLNGSNVLKILVDNATHQIIGFVTFFTYSVLVDLKSVTFYDLKCVNINLSITNYFIYAATTLLFSGALDVDHFLAAKSLSIYGATHLSNRPFGHCITVVLFIYFILYAAERTVGSFSNSHRTCSSTAICNVTCQRVSHKSQRSHEVNYHDLDEDYCDDMLESQNTIRKAFDSKQKNTNMYISVSTLYLLSALSHLLRDSYKRGLWFWLIYSYMTPPLYFSIHLVLVCILPYAVMFVM